MLNEDETFNMTPQGHLRYKYAKNFTQSSVAAMATRKIWGYKIYIRYQIQATAWIFVPFLTFRLLALVVS